MLSPPCSKVPKFSLQGRLANLFYYGLLGIRAIHPSSEGWTSKRGVLILEGQGSIGHCWVDSDAVHTIVHHAHKVPGECVGLCVHVGGPSPTANLFGLQQLDFTSSAGLVGALVCCF